MTNGIPDLPDDVADFFGVPKNEDVFGMDFAPPSDNWSPSEPPDDDWFAPEPPSEANMTPDFADLLSELAALDKGAIPELPDLTGSPSEAQMGLFDYAPEDDPFVAAEFNPGETPIESGEYAPKNTWERYLAAFPAERNPDVVEQELIDRAQALNVVDAQFVGVERTDETGVVTGYEVGCLEVSADVINGGYTGRYLEIGQFQDMPEAENLYHALQGEVHNGGLPTYAVHDYAEFAAHERGLPTAWREVDSETLAPFLEGQAVEREMDEPPLELHEQLVQVAVEAEPLDQDIAVNTTAPAFNALSAIGIQAEDFNPDHDPPPFYDAETGTAYWIGIFQPDTDDPENCVASILSLGRNPETGAVEAQLAPCVPGDWDKAFASSQHLLNVMEREGLDACFLAAESMAIATDQRELWESERGMALEPDYAEQAAEYTRETWELEL